MSLGDLAAIKLARFQLLKRPEVVDIHGAVDFGCMELRAALPEQRRLFRFTLDQHIELPAYPRGLGLLADSLLDLHQLALALLDDALGHFFVERKGLRAVFVGVTED